jgi:hypothetical protein
MRIFNTEAVATEIISTLKTEAICSPYTLVTIYQSARVAYQKTGISASPLEPSRYQQLKHFFCNRRELLGDAQSRSRVLWDKDDVRSQGWVPTGPRISLPVPTTDHQGSREDAGNGLLCGLSHSSCSKFGLPEDQSLAELLPLLSVRKFREIATNSHFSSTTVFCSLYNLQISSETRETLQ